LDFSPASLNPLQRAVIDAVAGQAQFFLTGGAALAAYYLHHRRSLDIDLFVTDSDALESLEEALLRAGMERGWQVEELRRTPGFRRFLLRHGPEETLVDLVHEPVRQIVAVEAKPRHGQLTVDALDDLVANKLGALLGRSDVKDLVDLYYIAQAGIDPLAHLDAARAKDGGVEAITLAHVLRGVKLDTGDLLLAEPLPAWRLAEFRDQLVERLLRLAWPGER
jgi:hypothetical protein